MKVVICFMLLVYLLEIVFSLKIPSQQVHVVTPSSRLHSEEGRAAPFYYHNWRRRMDSPKNETKTTTSTSTTPKTPDLIFAEFESGAGGDMRKSIRNLLEKERIMQKTSTTVTYKTSTLQPIYVPDDDSMEVAHEELTKKQEVVNNNGVATDDFNNYNNDQVYNYLPSTTTTISPPPLTNVENIWHIIDSEKRNQYSNKWKEVPIGSNNDQTNSNDSTQQQDEEKTKAENDVIDENFAFPGFPANPGNGAENESRAIRTDPNAHFPYVSLKPFQMKHVKNPISNQFSNSKKGPNMYNNLDNFKEIHHPVRGEVQDVNLMQQPIERYNPAQPYLPKEYGSKSKQSNSNNTPSIPSKVVANLVPPPLPPPPKVTGNDFPVPTSYESFPPYQVPSSDIAPTPSPPAANPPVLMYPSGASLDSPSFPSENDDSNDGPGDLSYQYNKPPSLSFRPTLPPLSKPFVGYSYNKPAASVPQTNNVEGSSYNKPAMTMDAPPLMDTGVDSPPMNDDKPDFQGYQYSKPSPPENFDSHDSYHHNDDYPELIFNKPYGGSKPMKGGNDMKDDSAGMMPPPPPADMMPNMPPEPAMDDNGFPPGFPGDFKFHHDFDDHDLYHHHHHPTTTTTTTTTTESPRVNRYSYYYLGKKLYYLPLYFSVYFIVYVGALIIKAVLRHKIVYPNSFRPNDTTASFFAKRSVDSWDLSNENLHEVTGRVTKAIGEAAEKYIHETRRK